MIHRITLASSGKIFAADEGRSILVSAHCANVLIPYSCRGGRCGSCRGRVLSGQVEYPGGFPEALSLPESDLGYALFCSAFPRSDLIIETDLHTVRAQYD